MSDTPRTDAVALTYAGMPGGYEVDADFARELERENAALRHDIERLIAIASETLTENASLERELKALANEIKMRNEAVALMRAKKGETAALLEELGRRAQLEREKGGCCGRAWHGRECKNCPIPDPDQ